MDTKTTHSSVVLEIATNLYQATCICEWSSTISYYEEVDLLRAMHAHAVVTFSTYRNFQTGGQNVR